MDPLDDGRDGGLLVEGGDDRDDHRTPYRSLELEEAEHLAGPMRVGVLVEDALARPSAHRRGAGRVVQQAVVRVERDVGVLDDDELLAGLEPPLEPAVRVGHDRRAGRGQLEGPARRRAVDGGVRAPRDVEVDARCRDGAREDVERHVAEHPRAADVALEVAAAEREVDPRVAPGTARPRLAHPLPAELVPVAVEEDVVLLLDGQWPEETRGRPPRALPPPCARRAQQAAEAAFRVREDEVELGRIGAVVIVEARVHTAELRQAHRDVAVVEDDRNAVALAQDVGCRGSAPSAR